MASPIEDIKEDWEMTRKRYTAWWAHEMVDRALIQVTAPKPGESREPWAGGISTPEINWTDIDFMIWRMLEDIRNTFYGGEALPLFYHNWSIGHALLMGCEPQFTPDTVWTEPLSVSADGYPIIQFQREGCWWQWMRDCTLRATQASQGRYFVMPMWGNHAADTLALIRGSENLMLDIVENPAWVQQATRLVSEILYEVVTALWSLVGEEISGIEGSVNYCNTWSPGKTMGFDCDISCMLSPRQFEDLFLPPLIETMSTVDHRIYHLDGTVALQHLDLLLSVPEIHAIQWVPGAGRDEILQWIPLIKRIQGAGKSVLVYASAQEIPALLEEVSARGLCIGTSCASHQEANDLLGQVKRLSKGW